jgi:hypothetical protein
MWTEPVQATMADARIEREATTSMTAPATTRPTGITILSILAGLNGISLLFFGFAAMGLGAAIAGGMGALFGLAALALGGLYLALAWGFWTVQPWGWPLGVVLAAAGIILAIVMFLLVSKDIVSLILGIAFPAVILYYLNQPGIKSLFGR